MYNFKSLGGRGKMFEENAPAKGILIDYITHENMGMLIIMFQWNCAMRTVQGCSGQCDAHIFYGNRASICNAASVL